MPTFEDEACAEFEGDLCVGVLFSNSKDDLLILSHATDSDGNLMKDTYEGYLKNEKEVSVVLIDVPSTNKRMVSISNYFVYIRGERYRYRSTNL